MAMKDAPITSYTDTTNQIRVITDAISMIDPVDTPLVAYFGLSSANSKFNFTATGTKIEWLEDEFATRIDSINGSIASNTTAWTVDDATVYQVGDVVLCGAEYCVVGTVAAATNVITIFSRTYGGTQASHADNAAVTVVGMARLEGADATFGPTTAVSAPYNYTGIFQKGVKTAGTMKAVSQYGVSNEMAFQADKAVPELTRKLELSLFHGTRDAGSATAPRSAGGLATYITANTVNAGGAITAADFEGAMELVTVDGGQPKLAVMSPGVLRDVRDVLNASGTMTITQGETRLGVRVLSYLSQFGEIGLMYSRWCPDSVCYLLDPRHVGIYELRPFTQYPVARVGDADRAEVVGEYSLVVRHDEAHGKIYGITT